MSESGDSVTLLTRSIGMFINRRSHEGKIYRCLGGWNGIEHDLEEVGVISYSNCIGNLTAMVDQTRLT